MAFSSSEGLPGTTPVGEAERKFGAALFADLSGYTALCQRLDPEDVELTIRPVMRALRGAVSEFGGAVMTVAGDGFFAMFGVPQSLADAPLRALRAALQMRELVAKEHSDPERSEVPDVHIGIAAGEVLVTPSDDDPGGLALVGNAINLASRLCDAAGPGEILVDSEAKAIIGPHAEWHGSRAVEVRGHAEAVVAWEPANAGSAVSFVYREPTFVGRQDVFAALDQQASAVASTRALRIVDVAGDAGIGKSRAVTEWLRSRRHQHTKFVCSPEGGNAGAVDLLRVVASRLDIPSDELNRLMAPAFSTAPRPDPAAAIEVTLRRYLSRLASQRLHVLAIENYDDADTSLALALRDLAAAGRDLPVLVLVLQRSQDLTSSGGGLIQVGPLKADEVELMATQLLAASPPPALLHGLIDRVGGNPLLAIHTVAYLVESGALHGGPAGHDVPPGDALPGTLPGNLRMFVSARIDALSPPAKSLVRALSTFGEPASPGFISDVLGEHVLVALQPLVSSGLLRRGSDARYDFAHKLNREVTYASLTRRTRADLHRRQLQVLPSSAAPALRSFHALGWYENASERTDEAQEAARAALRECLDHAHKGNLTSSVDALQILLKIQPVLARHADLAPETAASTWLLESQCELETGEFNRALSAANQAIEIAARSDARRELQRALLAQGAALSRLHRNEAARQSLDQAFDLADTLGDRSAKANALRLIGYSWRHTAFRRFAELTEDAHHLYVEDGNTAGAAESARDLAYLYAAASVALHERWSSVARRWTEPGDIRGRAWLALASAFAAAGRLDYGQAAHDAAEATRLGASIGAIDIEVDGRTAQIVSQFSLGNVPEALRQAEELLSLGALANYPRMRATAAVQSAGTFLRAGNRGRCREELEIARDVYQTLGAVEAEALAATEGAVAAIRGDWARALEAFVEDERAAMEAGYELLALQARGDQARIRLERGDDPGHLAELLEECRQARAPLIASYVRAFIERATLRISTSGPSDHSHPNSTLEERAFRADTAAIWSELKRENALGHWCQSLALWQRLGYSVWLARAQARCGDRAAAEHTLDVLDSPDEARRWALAE